MKAISLFSGAGGLDLGFKRAGYEIVWANDNDPDAVETYRRNIGRHITLDDIRQVDAEDIPNADVVIGGFPCQGFSVANTKRSSADSRNDLYIEFLRVVEKKRPLAFVAENVSGLLSMSGGAVIEMIVSDFEAIGYKVKKKLLVAADFGVAQVRRRVFIVGVRQDVEFCFEFPEATHGDPLRETTPGVTPWVGCGEALKNVPDPDEPHTLANHTYSKYKLRFNGYLGHREIDPDRPAPTVTARGDNRGGVVVLHHPSNTRRMTARELATVQSFPVDFAFHGTQSSVYRQIGNAVPPLLAEAVAKALLPLSSHVTCQAPIR